MFLKGRDKMTSEVNERFESFVTTVTRAYKSIQKIKNIEMEKEKLGLRGNHVMCMYFLGKNSGGLTAAELCKLCNEDKAAVSRTILDLTQKGLVKPVEKASKRKYRTMIKLSEDGLELNEKLRGMIEQAVKKGSADFTDDERRIFYKVFFSIVNNLEELTKNEYSTD